MTKQFRAAAEVDDRGGTYRHDTGMWDARQAPPWWPDPTPNVKDLGRDIKDIVAAEIRRQDDLREASSSHLRELMQRDREHAKELRAAEADRIDAIQTRSDLTVQRAAEVQATQAQALATQVATTADAFRSAMAAELSPVKASIEDLRRAQYEAQGQKTQVVESRDVRGEARLNIGAIVGIVGGIVGFIGLLLALYLATKKLPAAPPCDGRDARPPAPRSPPW